MDNFVLKGRSGQFEFGYVYSPGERNKWVTRDRDSGEVYMVPANNMQAAFKQARRQGENV